MLKPLLIKVNDWAGHRKRILDKLDSDSTKVGNLLEPSMNGTDEAILESYANEAGDLEIPGKASVYKNLIKSGNLKQESDSEVIIARLTLADKASALLKKTHLLLDSFDRVHSQIIEARFFCQETIQINDPLIIEIISNPPK